MKNKKSTVLGILALLCMASVCIACGDEAEETKTTDAATDEKDSAVTEYDPRNEYASTRPDVEDLEGYEYVIASESDGGVVSFVPEEEDGEILNDSVYRRNMRVMEAYNCKMTFYPSGDNSVVMQNVQAGVDFAGVHFSGGVDKSLLLAQQGFYYDLYELEALKLDQPWWDQRFKDTMEFYGSLYFMVGDIDIGEELKTYFIMYNKKLHTDYDLPDVYEMVLNGTWTLTEMYAMAKGMARDINGDGDFTTVDQYGFIADKRWAWYQYCASGREAVYFDEKSNEFATDVDDEIVYDILEQVFEVGLDRTTSMIVDGHYSYLFDDDKWGGGTSIFMQDRALFLSERFARLIPFRDMESDYGILPYPKYEAAQDGYYCFADADPLGVPVTASDLHAIGLITEALAFESKFELQPAFYEAYIDEKLLRDETSKQIIDIIFESKVYSLEYFGDITGLYMTAREVLSLHKNNMASRSAALKKSAQKKLDKYIEAFEKIN